MSVSEISREKNSTSSAVTFQIPRRFGSWVEKPLSCGKNRHRPALTYLEEPKVWCYSPNRFQEPCLVYDWSPTTTDRGSHQPRCRIRAARTHVIYKVGPIRSSFPSSFFCGSHLCLINRATAWVICLSPDITDFATVSLILFQRRSVSACFSFLKYSKKWAISLVSIRVKRWTSFSFYVFFFLPS